MRFPRSFDLRWALAGSLAVHLLALAFLRGQTPLPERLLEVDLSELPAKPTPVVAPTPQPTAIAPTPAPQVLATPLPLAQLPPPAPQPIFAPSPKLTSPPQNAPEPTAPSPAAKAAKIQATIQKPKLITPKRPTPGRQITKRPTDSGSSPAPQRSKLPLDGQRAPLNNAPNVPRRDNEEAGKSLDNNSRPQRPMTAMRPPGGERSSPFRSDSSAPQDSSNSSSDAPTPRGLNPTRPAANAPDNEAPKFDPRRFGTSTKAQDKALGNAQGGSARGRDAELAGTSGAGGVTLPSGVPRRGGDSAARNNTLFASKSDDSAPKNSGVDVTPLGPSKRTNVRDTGAGTASGGGTGFASSGPNRAAFNPRPGAGIGSSSGGGIGGAQGKRSGGGGEMAGGGASGGGLRIGGGNGGNGRSGPRLADNGGTPFGAGGNGNGGVGNGTGGNGAGGNGGGSGKGGGPGGPGRGALLARREGGGAGGPGAGGAGGRGGKGFGPGLSAGGGNGGGNGGDGGGGGNGKGGRGKGGGAGNGDEAGGGQRGVEGAGSDGVRRLSVERGRLKTAAEAGREVGRGIWAPGLVGKFYQDPDQGLLDPGHAIDWPVLGDLGSKFVTKHTNQTIDFNWGIDAPLKGMRGTYWSVRWTGRIFVPKTDEYRFFLEDVDDGGRLVLDGIKIIEAWQVQRSSPGSGKMRLERGPHEITLDYVQGPATASSVRLMWESASFPRELVGSYLPGS